MIVDTVKLMECRHTGKVLNNLPVGRRESLAACISNENKGSESTVFLAEELVNLYKSVYKGTSKTTLLFLYKLLIRLIENGSDRYIDVVVIPQVPLKRAGLRRLVERLEALQLVEYYLGWSSTSGSVPACIRAAYAPDELKARAQIALDKKVDKL